MVRKYQGTRKPAPEVTIVSSGFQEHVAESFGAVSSVVGEDSSQATLPGSVKVQLLGVSARCSFSQVHNVINRLDDRKKALVREIGFGGLLDFPSFTSMDRKFVAWLMCRVDPSSQMLIIDETRKLKFCKEDISKVFGIPFGGNDVSVAGRPSNGSVARIMTHYLGLKPKDNRSIRYIQEVVLRDYGGSMSDHDCASFKVAFVIYVMSTVLAPRAKYDNAAADYWGALLVPEDIGSFDWCEYVMRRLMDAVAKIKEDLNRSFKCTNITGCSLFLQVLYLDSMDCGVLTLEHNIFPRIKFFSGDRVKSMIRLDTFEPSVDSEGGRYGRTKARMGNGVCYFWARACDEDSSLNLSRVNAYLWEICTSLARLLLFPSNMVRAIYNLAVRSGISGGIQFISGILQFADRRRARRKRKSGGEDCEEHATEMESCDGDNVCPSWLPQDESKLELSFGSDSGEASRPSVKRPRNEVECDSVTQHDVSVFHGRDISLRQVGLFADDVGSSSIGSECRVTRTNGVHGLFEKLRLFASCNDVSRPVISHPLPKYIEVFHHELRTQLSGAGEVEPDTFDVILRAFTLREVAERCGNGRLRRRHYVENDFMRFVLEGTLSRVANRLKHLVSGDPHGYDVRLCDLFFFPARIAHGWICLCWNRHRNEISVFDPLKAMQRYVNASGVFCDIVNLLKCAIADFVVEVKVDWLRHMSTAAVAYIPVHDMEARPNLSGAMCAFFCRNYDGNDRFEDIRNVDSKELLDIIADDVMNLLGTMAPPL